MIPTSDRASKFTSYTLFHAPLILLFTYSCSSCVCISFMRRPHQRRLHHPNNYRIFPPEAVVQRKHLETEFHSEINATNSVLVMNLLPSNVSHAVCECNWKRTLMSPTPWCGLEITMFVKLFQWSDHRSVWILRTGHNNSCKDRKKESERVIKRRRRGTESNRKMSSRRGKSACVQQQYYFPCSYRGLDTNWTGVSPCFSCSSTSSWSREERRRKEARNEGRKRGSRTLEVKKSFFFLLFLPARVATDWPTNFSPNRGKRVEGKTNH